MPEGWRAYLIKAVKDAVSIPVMGVSVIRHPEFAEKLLEDGNQDFICMGRTFLAEPYWVKKIEEGRECELRKCISCLHCFESYLGAIGTGKTIECALNPTTAHEHEYGCLKTDGDGRTVVVVGAGPAGMEAARVLALRGFKPVVLEKNSYVGGQMNIADKATMKFRITELIATMKAQLDALGIEIKLNTEATAETIKALEPHAVVVATGGEAAFPGFIPGVDSENVYLGVDVLTGKVQLSGQKVAVIGGGHTGLETAEFLGDQGNQVSIIEMASKIGPDMYAQNVMDLTMRLKAQNAKFLTCTKLLSIDGKSLSLKSTANLKTFTIEADSVVLTLGTRSVNALADELKDLAIPVVTVGDAVSPAKIGDATRSAYLAASKI